MFAKVISTFIKMSRISPIIGVICIAFSFNSFSQSISIGSPIDGTEGGANVSFTISLDNGAVNNTGAPITGTISYGGTATPAVDYTQVTTFTIPNGVSSILITIPVIDDIQIECTETVVAIISTLSVGVIGVAASSADIIDDECPMVLVISIGSPVDATESPTTPSNVSFTVFLEGGLINNTGVPITGTISYTGSAISGADYSPVFNFSIPVGANFTTIDLAVIDDFSPELTETVTPNLVGVPNLGTYGNISSTAYIYDDDAANITISIDHLFDGEEGAGDVGFVVSLDMGLVNTTGSDIYGSVNYGGTATSADFTNAQALFSIPNGEYSDTIFLDVNDDFCVEFTETVIATISSPNVGTISNGSATANIEDNDSVISTVSIGSPADGEEGSADVSFIVFLDNGLANCTGVPVTGTISFSGTAIEGVDYTSISTFSIPDGASFAAVVIPVVDDLDVECDETVIATISNPLIGSIGVATSSAIIVDNECTNSIDEISDAGLSIYPNPVSSELNFEAEKQMKSYSIADLSGKVYFKGEVDSKYFMIELDFLSSGYYLVSILFEDGSIVKRKVVKD